MRRVTRMCFLILMAGSVFGAGEVIAELDETERRNAIHLSESLALAVPDGPDFHPVDAGWTLRWADEFNADQLDLEKWRPEVSCWGGGNNERQCYTGQTENIRVSNGQLLLIARAGQAEGPKFPPEFNRPPERASKAFSSGKVRTRGLAQWRYGRFEMRAKLPSGQGTWPAFWMLPAGELTGGLQPYSGEIDIMEAVNLGAPCKTCQGNENGDGEVGQNQTTAALHVGSAELGHSSVGYRAVLPDASNPADDYHVWAAEWAQGQIAFFLDGVMYARVTSTDFPALAYQAQADERGPFDQAYYLMLNLAIGGVYPESVNARGIDETAIPAVLAVDWVRVYQCGEDETGRACLSK